MVNRLPMVMGVGPVLLGMSVLLGWHSGQAVLIQVSPQFVPMQYNTALGIVFTGLALILLGKNAARWAMPFSVATILIGALTGLQYLVGADFGIDQIFMDHYITTETSHAGRMAPNTALSFVLAGTGLLTVACMKNPARRQWVAGVIGSIVLGLGLVAVAEYAAGLSPAYGWGVLNRMAVHTAGGFAMLGVGLISMAWRDTPAYQGQMEKPSAWWPVSAAIFVVSFTALLADALDSHERTLFDQTVEPTSTFAPSVVLVFGVLMGVLLGTTLWSNRRSKLRAIAAEMLAKRLAEEEAATRESEARFRSLFETIEIGTIMIDVEGIIQIFNPAASEMFGYRPDEVVGKNVSILMPEPDCHQHDSYIKNYLKTGENKVIYVGRQVIGLRKNGDEFPLQLQVGEMIVNKETCWVGSVADLTEFRSLESQLRQSQKLEAVGQLTGGVAHDFNNLLAVIQGNLSLLADDLHSETEIPVAELMELLQPALAASGRGADLIQRLLAFSRKQALSPRTLHVNGLIIGMEGLLRSTLGEHIDLQIELSESEWAAMIDPSQLESALLNLVLNARDAMIGGGRLTIETKSVELDQSYVDTHPGASVGDYVLLAVSDTGQGMKPEILEKAFDPFFTTKGVGMGSGLGLSMVHGFVKQSEGYIAIYSEPVNGTSVKLYLPRSKGGEEPAEAYNAVPRAGGDETILVVEDEEDVRRIVVRVLKRLGYRTIEAEDGKTALEQFENGPPIDLLITDVVLPGGMTGPDIARAVHKIKSGTRVLFMSGYTETAVVHHGRVDEGAHLLNKPFSAHDLDVKVREVLEFDS